MSNFYQKW